LRHIRQSRPKQDIGYQRGLEIALSLLVGFEQLVDIRLDFRVAASCCGDKSVELLWRGSIEAERYG
jgi:hypothetical protein